MLSIPARRLFLHLPASDLVQFKLVCKSWHKIITGSVLAEYHLQRWKDKIGIMFIATNHILAFEPSYVSLDDISHDHSYAIHKLCPDNPYKFFKYYKILDTCDGLVLTLMRLMVGLNFEEKLLLSNPMTRMGTWLSMPPFGTSRSDRPFQRQWLYPDTKHIIYDASTQMYKVVCRRGEDGECYLMEVANSAQHLTSSWRKITILQSTHPMEYVAASVSGEGKLHWLIVKRLTIQNILEQVVHEDKVKLLTLDITTEKFIEVNCPLPYDQNNNMTLSISGSNGKFYQMRFTVCNDFELWDLRDLNSHRPTWFKRHFPMSVCTTLLPYLESFICESKDGGKVIFMSQDSLTFTIYESSTGKCTRHVVGKYFEDGAYVGQNLLFMSIV
ncbi:hypothetical protein SAY87_006871 [Trapa incisa]|uniref:F-box domain-containing protein n=1 Tax=Trapa incisa TaxID=236973 RepID=A0AAN7K025_9MYRT|nr:hypothetical protein SAY87_006871 [Trapa incisa]